MDVLVFGVSLILLIGVLGVRVLALEGKVPFYSVWRRSGDRRLSAFYLLLRKYVRRTRKLLLYIGLHVFSRSMHAVARFMEWIKGQTVSLETRARHRLQERITASRGASEKDRKHPGADAQK